MVCQQKFRPKCGVACRPRPAETCSITRILFSNDIGRSSRQTSHTYTGQVFTDCARGGGVRPILSAPGPHGDQSVEIWQTEVPPVCRGWRPVGRGRGSWRLRDTPGVSTPLFGLRFGVDWWAWRPEAVSRLPREAWHFIFLLYVFQ